ncbi:helix-turn-helix domain-containing protein [Zoogloea dura]|uniref:Helix-turn-helix domain-containing protein n=1 Tax=Zoogloea dura TaxID=2728840 RepID=A0A848G5A3_9RHOO|nr:helix-turn-helix domain-containing protein [Zoogloea dura]NML27408.1 helix-turn-helix domain-containing protein [Zoogloea dura]
MISPPGSPTAPSSLQLSDGASFTEYWAEDAEEQSRYLSGWDQRYEQLSPGPFRGHTSEVQFSKLQVFRERSNCSLQETCSVRKDALVIGVPVALEGLGWCNGWALDGDTLLLHRPGDDVLLRTPASLDLIAVSLPWSDLVHHARAINGDELPAAISRSGQALHDPALAREIRSFLLSVLDSISASPAILNYAAVRQGLKEGVLNTVISVIGNAPPQNAAPRTSKGRQALILRAMDYMRSRIGEPIPITDLCAALCVSQRTLQYCFEEVLQTNPVAYLKALRLNGVRKELKRGRPAEITVQDIAARWGFWHLSRFAQEYRLMFGELPSDTLRSERGLPPAARPATERPH